MASSLSVLNKHFLHAAFTALLLWGGAAWSDEDLRLNPEQMQVLGVQAIKIGDDVSALQIADALLKRDPEDVRALILKSRASRNLGDFRTARLAGQAAWRLAESDEARYAAALVTAQALASGDNRTWAQLWLRRAVDVAPDDATRARAIYDYRYVRARNPLSFEFSFNVVPTNNINNGSRRDTTSLFGLPFEFQLDGAAQALEGTEISAGVVTRYRFDQSERHAHELVAQLQHRDYILSSDAKAQAPGVTGSDFAFSQASLGYTYRATPANGLGPYTLDATAGQIWYGGEEYFSYVRAGGTQRIALGDLSKLTLSGSAEHQFGAQIEDADVVRGDVRLERKIGDLGVLGLSTGLSASSSDQDIGDYSEVRAGVDFSLAKPVLGAHFSFGLTVMDRDYPRSSYDPAGRQDREVSASINMVFTQIDRYGFNPTFSVIARNTESNIGLFDSEEIGVRFGIRSAF